jgi:uncharacterized protein YdgA (DUF945 family)
MKKILTVALVLVLAAALIGPKIVGSKFADGIQNTVVAIDKNPNYTASLKSIESKWFSTKAEVVVGLIMPDMSEMTGQDTIDMSITLDVIGNHGPFIFSDGFAIGWLRSAIKTQSTELPEGLVLPNNDPFYQFNGLTGLFGTTTYTDQVAAIEYTDPATQGLISFTGLNGNGELSSTGVEYKAVSEGVKMDIENMLSFNMQNFTFDAKSSESLAGMMSKGLYDSQVNFATELLTFNDLNEGTEVLIADTEIQGVTDYDISSDLGSIIMTTTVASVVAPDLNMTDLNSIIEIKNLQGKFILAYQEFASKMSANLHDSEQIQSDLDAFIETYLPEQLKAKPEYNFSNISGKINGSDFTGNIMTKLADITELPSTFDDTAFWMQHIIVNSEIKMNKDAAEFVAATVISQQLAGNPNFAALSEQEQTEIMIQQVQGTIQGLVQQEMLVQEGEDYRVSFTMENGLAVLNGNPIPL